MARQTQQGLWAKQQAERNARRIRLTENQAFSNRLDITDHGLDSKEQLYNSDIRKGVVDRVLTILGAAKSLNLAHTKAFIPKDRSGNFIMKASRIEVQ